MEELGLSETALALLGCFIVVAFVLAGIGERIGRLVFPKGLPPSANGLKGFRWFFRVTLVFHGFFAGVLVGFAPLPVPEFMGGLLVGRLFWYGAAGMCSVPVYNAIMKKLEAMDDD